MGIIDRSLPLEPTALGSPQTGATIRVGMLDHHAVVRKAVRDLLVAQSDFKQ